MGTLACRRFPDGESLVRIESSAKRRAVILCCTLRRPDARLIQLLLAARTARELGASSVGLVAPYLAYMRQDTRFHPGEAVSSRILGDILSTSLDWIATVDPHLHRHRALSEVFSIPALAIPSARLLAAWIRDHVAEPVLIGPDAESKQWVHAVAAAAGLPSIVLRKIRRGDRDVSVSAKTLEACRGRTPVLIDDIVSTGGTLAATVKLLRRARMRAPTCVVVHGLFAPGALAALTAAGAGRIVTTNSIPHASNAIDIVPLIAQAVAPLAR